MTSSEKNATPPNDENNSSHGQPEASHSAVELKAWPRAAASIVSLCSLIAGGIAVFTTDNQAGTAVLFAGGVFGGIIALGGRLPISVKIGDSEIKMAQARFLDAATEKIEEASPEEASEIITSVAASGAAPLSTEQAEARQQAIWRRLSKLESLGENYQRLVYNTIQGWAWGKSVNLRLEEKGFDIALTGQKRTAIETVVRSPGFPLTVTDVDRFARLLLAARNDFDYFIFISNADLDLMSEDYWSKISVLQEPEVRFITAEDHVNIANKLIPMINEIEESGSK